MYCAVTCGDSAVGFAQGSLVAAARWITRVAGWPGLGCEELRAAREQPEQRALD